MIGVKESGVGNGQEREKGVAGPIPSRQKALILGVCHCDIWTHFLNDTSVPTTALHYITAHQNPYN